MIRHEQEDNRSAFEIQQGRSAKNLRPAHQRQKSALNLRDEIHAECVHRISLARKR